MPTAGGARIRNTRRAGVFGAFSTAAETRRRFPLLEWILDREMALGIGDQERAGETGWLNDGDTASFGCWLHGGAGAAEGSTPTFCAQGDPAIWARARRQVLHLREVCTWWSNEESAFQHPRAGRARTSGIAPTLKASDHRPTLRLLDHGRCPLLLEQPRAWARSSFPGPALAPTTPGSAAESCCTWRSCTQRPGARSIVTVCLRLLARRPPQRVESR